MLTGIGYLLVGDVSDGENGIVAVCVGRCWYLSVAEERGRLLSISSWMVIHLPRLSGRLGRVIGLCSYVTPGGEDRIYVGHA